MIYNYDQLFELANQVGFDIYTSPTIAAIALAESYGDDMAINPHDPNGGSFGVLQINGIHANAKDTLGNALLSFKIAFEISKHGTDFTPWATFTSGRFVEYLPKQPTIPTIQPVQSVSSIQSTMNPAANAATSGGTAGAIVALIAWGLSFAHIVLPADVAAAIQILLTSGIGYFIHTQTRTKP